MRHVALDAQDERGVAEAHAVARGGAVDVGVGGSGEAVRHRAKVLLIAYCSWCEKPPAATRERVASRLTSLAAPSARLLPPRMTRLPAIWTSRTLLVSPGSKRTAVPAGMSSRRP